MITRRSTSSGGSNTNEKIRRSTRKASMSINLYLLDETACFCKDTLMIIRKSLCDMEDTDIRLSSSLGMTRSKMRFYLYILSFTSDIGISKIVSYFLASAFLWQSQRILKSPKIKPLLVARESTNSEASLTKSAAFRPFVLVIGT